MLPSGRRAVHLRNWERSRCHCAPRASPAGRCGELHSDKACGCFPDPAAFLKDVFPSPAPSFQSISTHTKSRNGNSRVSLCPRHRGAKERHKPSILHIPQCLCRPCLSCPGNRREDEGATNSRPKDKVRVPCEPCTCPTVRPGAGSTACLLLRSGNLPTLSLPEFPEAGVCYGAHLTSLSKPHTQTDPVSLLY